MEVSIDFKDTLLKELVKNLSTKKKIQIGIFGDSGLAEVAQKMEYGANDIKTLDFRTAIRSRIKTLKF